MVLLDAKADVNLRDKDGKNVLHICTSYDVAACLLTQENILRIKRLNNNDVLLLI
jgi:ankyrin repeat protein